MPADLFKRVVSICSLRIEHLWICVVLAGFGFFTSLVPLYPNDFWWHLKIGEIIHTHGQIPTTNLFAWSLPIEQPFTYAAWLGEWLLYVLYRWGGLALPIFARTLVAVVTFWLVGYETKRRSGSWRIAALATALAYLMVVNNLPVRPQIWSWLPFMAFWIVLSKFSSRQIKTTWLLILPAIMVFWVNLHGAFMLGLALQAIFFIGEAIRKLLKQPEALDWKSILWIGAASAGTGLATLVNPRFLGIARYVLDLMTDQPSQSLIQEWQSPTPQGAANIAFYFSVLLLLGVLAYSRYHLTPTELLLIFGFLWLAWSGQRYVIWFSMVAMPILGQAIQGLLKPSLQPVHLPPRLANTMIAGLVFLPLILAQPWFIDRIPLPAAYREQVLPADPKGPLISTRTPVAAVEFLRNHPGGKLFNEMGYGSYLIWALPKQRIFIDPRVELYPIGQWEDYIDINRGARWQELLDRYGADRILLDLELQAELALALEGSSLWELEYSDAYSQIWKKQGK